MLDKDKKFTAHMITLVLLALYLSLFESLIPKPFPWMKIGLANLATLITFDKFGIKMGIEVFYLRVFTASFILGTFLSPGFIISIVSGTFSLISMIILFKYKKYFSIIAISSIAGIIHNIGQLISSYFIYFRDIEILSKYVLYFIIVFLFMGFISGIINGFIAYKVLHKNTRRV
jgi:heptaprenyl diphosphate synthase